MIRQSAIYLAGRLVPGAVSLLTVALFTRWLGPEQYGQYAIILAVVSTINAVCFQWLSLSLGRLLPAHEARPEGLFATVTTAFLGVMALLWMVWALAAWQGPAGSLQWFLPLALAIACAQTWFDMNLRVINMRFAPFRYGVLMSVKAAGALLAGLALLAAGFGVRGVLWGLVASLLIAPILAGRQWREFRPGIPGRPMFKALVSYGMPLAVTFVLTLVVDVTGRLLLGWYRGPGEAGAYAAAFDLTQGSLGMVMSVVHLAAFPLVVRTLESGGAPEAQRQLRKTGSLLLALSVPAAAGMALAARNISAVMLGPGFQTGSDLVIAIAAGATFLSGIRAYYFDYSFQLARRMRGQAWTLAVVAVTNVVLNLVWIPAYGVAGASCAALGAFGAGLLASRYLGMRVFHLPGLSQEAYKIVLSAGVMAAVLVPMRTWVGLPALASQVLLALLVYGTMMILLDFQGLRSLTRGLLSAQRIFPKKREA